MNQQREVATYRAVLDTNIPGAEPPAPDQPWTMLQALRIANRSNESLGIEGETYLQALIDKARAYSAFMPTIGVSPSESFSHVRGGNTSNSTGISAHGSINLFNGFQDVAALDRASVTVEQRRWLLLDLQESLLLSVAQSYYQILKSEESARVLENSLSLRAEQVRDMSARVQTGIARPLDLAQAQADQSATRVLLLQAQSDARNARTALAFLVGVPRIDGPLSDDFAAPTSRPTEEEFEQQAQASREDLAASQRAVEAARYAVSEAVRQYYPSVSLNVSYLLYASPSSPILWSSVFSGNIPIFTAGVIHQDVRAAWSRFRQATLSLAQLERQVTEQVRTDAENFSISGEKISELNVEVQAAQRAFDLADRQYKLGAASNLDRLTAQNQLLSAQLQLNTESYNQKVFYLDLLRVSGRFVDDIVKEKRD